MAKRSKLDSYLASVRTAPASAPIDPVATARARDAVVHGVARAIAAPVSDAEAIEIADALVGPPVDSAASRAYADELHPSVRSAIGGDASRLLRVPGVGPIVVLRRDDGSIDRALLAFRGTEIAKYRRTSARNPAMKWWIESGLGGGEASALLDALATVTAPIPVAVAPARTAPVVAVAPAPVPAPASEAPAKRERSTDPGVSAALAMVVAHMADASELERVCVAKLREGEIVAVAAWAASAWLEGRAVTLFGGEHARAMAARDALRSACATFLRARADAPRGGIAVDDVMGAIGGAA